jgi:hypothetical protein
MNENQWRDKQDEKVLEFLRKKKMKEDEHYASKYSG